MRDLIRSRTNRSEGAPCTADEPELASALLEHLSDGVIACNADGTTLTFNRRAREIFGPPEHEVSQADCARYFSLYVPGEERPMRVDELPLARALSGEHVRDAIVEVRPRAGGRRIVSVSGEPVIGRRGRVAGAVIVMQDITDRLEVEAALRLQGAITAHLPQVIVVTRASDGDIVYVNEAAGRMFGYGPGELVGRPMSILNVGSERAPAQRAREILRALESEGVWSGDVQNARKDGTHITCAVTVSPLEHEEHGTLWISVHTEVVPPAAS